MFGWRWSLEVLFLFIAVFYVANTMMPMSGYVVENLEEWKYSFMNATCKAYCYICSECCRVFECGHFSSTPENGL